MNTAFKSDVHVAECTFNNTSPSGDQAGADDGLYNISAQAVSSVYTTTVAETSANGQDVVQPTAQEMLRYWQAFQMVSHGYYIHPVRRNLSVSLEVVQLRLSVVIVTMVTFVLGVSTAAVAHCNEPLDENGEHINLPKSQLDWMVEAARQHHVEGDHKSYVDYAKEHDDLVYGVSTAHRGLSRTQITSTRDKSVMLPSLGYLDHHSLRGNPTSSVDDFDPYSLYDVCRAHLHIQL